MTHPRHASVLGPLGSRSCVHRAGARATRGRPHTAQIRQQRASTEPCGQPRSGLGLDRGMRLPVWAAALGVVVVVAAALVEPVAGQEQWPRNEDGEEEEEEDNPNIDESQMDPMKWANRVTKKRTKKAPEREIDPESGLPKAQVHAHRTLKPEDLSYDFLAKMGFVPPPPPPPWGFNKDGNSTAEIEERVMRQLIPIVDLPTTMMCDACGAVATQLAAKLKKADRINEKRFRVGKKLGEYELLAALDELCEGKFALDRDSKEPVPSDWDEYGVADLNDTCASPPLVSCWNSTKRLVGPGCAKTYEWKREKEVRFGWLTTRIKPECERLISEYGDDELELYELVRKFEYNATQISKILCKKDCKRAAKVQAEEARKKYVEQYEEWEKRQSWAKELGYEEHVPITAEEVEAKRKEIAEEKKQRRKTGGKKKHRKGDEL